VTEPEGEPSGGKRSSVVLSRIYTRTGDDGTTALGDMSRTAKTDPRLAAYAEVDTTNAAIGAVLALGDPAAELATILTRVQNDLFDVGADLSTPIVDNPPYEPLRVTDAYVERLESDCDAFNERLETLRSFVLPGGTPAAALLHQARTAARTAERATWAAIEAYGDGINPLTARYLNRLSDLLFILGREANREHGGDVLWSPGGGSKS
jgi:cob(I)alamin adenosyltransferase